ncbi:MAG: hypothetical protein ACTSRO_11900 [Candidatus Heimdallarchaeaceae archaeon]
MAKRRRLARRVAIYTIALLFIMTILVNSLIILVMEINTKKIVQNASNKYLDAKIQTMDTSIFQFVQSFDQLIGNMKKILNNTSQTVRSKFYTNENENDFVQNSIQFNSTDEFVFLDGVINASIDRLREINYYDHNGDGINDLAIPGSSLLGNIKNFLNISGPQ